MRFVTAMLGNNEVLGIVNPEKTHIAEINALGFNFCDMLDLVARITPQELEKLTKTDFASVKAHPLAETKLLSPIPRPKYDIICLGQNYAAHAEEFGSKPPEVPIYFGKRATSTAGHLSEIDGHFEVDKFMDYEVELAVIIGKEAKKITYETVEDYIFGYSIFNDFTSRSLQKRHHQWYLGKSTDGFASMGPWIVTKDEMPMPFHLSLESRVNGEVRQKSNTELLLHGIEKVLVEMSQSITLYPGDIIATGTPSGVGMGFDPPKMLKSGDVVECEIEGLGILKNFVK